MKNKFNLSRFLDAQNSKYLDAMNEIRQGKKETHWMWFIFPQMKGLGFSDYNIFYGIESFEEAQAYYDHPILGKHLIEITEELLKVENKTAFEIMGKSDEKKLKSCMTLFSLLPDTHIVFEEVLNKYYQGQKDSKTLDLLK